MTALDDASIEIAPGDYVAVVGSSGSGKSTLLLMLGGMLSPCMGRVFLNAICSMTSRRINAPRFADCWQRLVDEKGKTCDRCGNTEHAIDEANRLLTVSLKPLGMRVQVVETPLTAEQFKLTPSESNRIWIDDTPLDEILDAKTGESPCCGSCGDSDCRTMVVGRPNIRVDPAGTHRAGGTARGCRPRSTCCAR